MVHHATIDVQWIKVEFKMTIFSHFVRNFEGKFNRLTFTFTPICSLKCHQSSPELSITPRGNAEGVREMINISG